MKPRGPSILASCLTGCLGGVILIVVLVVFSMQAVGIFKNSATYTAPGSWSINIHDSGLVTIFADQGSSSPVHAANITVESPSGSTVTVDSFAQNVTSTVTLGSTTYTGVASFTAAKTGVYRMHVVGASGKMLVLPGVGKKLVGSALLSLVGIVIGGLLGLVGVVMLIVGITRRRQGPPVSSVPMQ